MPCSVAACESASMADGRDASVVSQAGIILHKSATEISLGSYATVCTHLYWTSTSNGVKCKTCDPTGHLPAARYIVAGQASKLMTFMMRYMTAVVSGLPQVLDAIRCKMTADHQCLVDSLEKSTQHQEFHLAFVVLAFVTLRKACRNLLILSSLHLRLGLQQLTSQCLSSMTFPDTKTRTPLLRCRYQHR